MIYVSIGNSDDKLSQEEWSFFQKDVDDLIQDFSIAVFGSWVSLPRDPWQNACWAFECKPDEKAQLRIELFALAATFKQDSIAWCEGPTEFIMPNGPGSVDDS